MSPAPAAHGHLAIMAPEAQGRFRVELHRRRRKLRVAHPPAGSGLSEPRLREAPPFRRRKGSDENGYSARPIHAVVLDEAGRRDAEAGAPSEHRPLNRKERPMNELIVRS